MKWLGMLALVVPLTAEAGTLNERFPFDAIYTLETVDVEGASVEFLRGQGSMGDLFLDFQYLPDVVGGHPLIRSLEILELDNPYPVFQGVILWDPLPYPGLLRFAVADDSPFGQTSGETWTWDVPWSRVPQLGSGWLVVSGLLWAVAYSLTWATKD